MKTTLTTLLGYILAIAFMTLSTAAFASYAENLERECASDSSYEYQICINNELRK